MSVRLPHVEQMTKGVSQMDLLDNFVQKTNHITEINKKVVATTHTLIAT